MVQLRISLKVVLASAGLSLLAVAAASRGSLTRSLINLAERDSVERGYQYVAPGPDDSRSPCPALNVLANHGYLPRDGRNIGPFDLVFALQEAYGLDVAISHLLAIGGFFLVHHNSMKDLPTPPPPLLENPRGFWRSLLGGVDHAFQPTELHKHVDDFTSWAKNYLEYKTMELHHIGLHGHIEHDASITHDDVPSPDDLYAPWASNHSLFEAFMTDSTAGKDASHVDLRDLGTARVRREEESQTWSGRALDALHAEIARGEAALVIGIFGESLPDTPAHIKHNGEDWSWDYLAVHKDVMRTFWLGERLPDNWRPSRVTTIKTTHVGNQRVGDRMKELRGTLKDAVVQTVTNATTPVVAAAQKVFGSA